MAQACDDVAPGHGGVAGPESGCLKISIGSDTVKVHPGELQEGLFAAAVGCFSHPPEALGWISAERAAMAVGKGQYVLSGPASAESGRPHGTPTCVKTPGRTLQ